MYEHEKYIFGGNENVESNTVKNAAKIILTDNIQTRVNKNPKDKGINKKLRNLTAVKINSKDHDQLCKKVQEINSSKCLGQG